MRGGQNEGELGREVPSGVDSWLWVPFSQPRGGEKEGHRRLEGRPTAAIVVAQQLDAQL